jgi:hypothetical protein
MKHKICKEFLHFYKFMFIKNDKFFFLIYWGNSREILIIFITNCKNNHLKIHSFETTILGKKDMEC